MPAESVMNSTTNNDPQVIPIAVDNDSRHLAIVYGSLGTLIAFASLVFAVLSWLRSRHQRLAAQDQLSVGIELGLNSSRHLSQTALQPPVIISTSHKYAMNNRVDTDSKLTLRSDHLRTTTALTAVDSSQPQPPFELEGDPRMPPDAHESCPPCSSTNINKHPSKALDTTASTPQRA
jgi:hypothetical protein